MKFDAITTDQAQEYRKMGNYVVLSKNFEKVLFIGIDCKEAKRISVLNNGKLFSPLRKEFVCKTEVKEALQILALGFQCSQVQFK